MANSISVAVADIDTMLVGSPGRVILPLAPVTVTGKCAWPAADEPVVAAEFEEPELPQAVSARSSASSRAVRAAVDRLDRRGERDTGSLHAEAEDIAHEPAGSMRDPYREGR
jgi:hypothetical protein